MHTHTHINPKPLTLIISHSEVLVPRPILPAVISVPWVAASNERRRNGWHPLTASQLQTKVLPMVDYQVLQLSNACNGVVNQWSAVHCQSQDMAPPFCCAFYLELSDQQGAESDNIAAPYLSWPVESFSQSDFHTINEWKLSFSYDWI